MEAVRALVQRVSEASVITGDRVAGAIGRGLLVLLGVKRGDTEAHAEYLAKKVVQLRVFADADGKMNLSLLDISGELLVVSQFTLYGETKKGNRPSYSDAATPESAEKLYDHFVKACRQRIERVETGVFQAHMNVHLVNDGPVTLMCYSEAQLTGE